MHRSPLPPPSPTRIAFWTSSTSQSVLIKNLFAKSESASYFSETFINPKNCSTTFKPIVYRIHSDNFSCLKHLNKTFLIIGKYDT